MNWVAISFLMVSIGFVICVYLVYRFMEWVTRPQPYSPRGIGEQRIGDCPQLMETNSINFADYVSCSVSPSASVSRSISSTDGWYPSDKLNIYAISSVGSGSLVPLSPSVIQVNQLQEIQRGFCNYCGSAFRPDEYECCKCGAPKERK